MWFNYKHSYHITTELQQDTQKLANPCITSIFVWRCQRECGYLQMFKLLQELLSLMDMIYIPSVITCLCLLSTYRILDTYLSYLTLTTTLSSRYSAIHSINRWGNRDLPWLNKILLKSENCEMTELTSGPVLAPKYKIVFVI